MIPNKTIQIQSNQSSQLVLSEPSEEDEILHNHPLLKDLIKCDHDSTKYYCIICKENGNSYFLFQKKHIVRHFESKKHKKIFGDDETNGILIQALKAKRSIKPSIDIDSQQEPPLDHQKDDIKLKFLIAEFIIWKRLPYSICDDLIDFFKRILEEIPLEVIMRFSICKTSLVRIINRCIIPIIKEEIFDSLRNSPYSLSLDESSDGFGYPYLAIFAKFIDRTISKCEPINKLILVIELTESQTGETLTIFKQN